MKFRLHESRTAVCAAALGGGFEAVTEEVKGINSKMIDSLSQDGAAEKLINTHAQRCNALGEAAQEALSK